MVGRASRLQICVKEPICLVCSGVHSIVGTRRRHDEDLRQHVYDDLSDDSQNPILHWGQQMAKPDKNICDSFLPYHAGGFSHSDCR
ncbi:hypothetical protein NEUTE1DRAFT_117067 [Neurospora tetrasperma FGSC 2508]|uniref:Uncharacterized protein n=1 Tax=Neurospora tetrasperma (strain FGSC 2508 / ATCC MYA-4615 / P0657) TaxID=510951 RepID=F8MJT8_NEUT8|nr:uncharacterized protein NEUTE1DRAFT_117067 [Neurospora tetrasperma FGSC 2508]EGO58125.1 hypothetical protein NEUTE1DRAFT_117067 [Neurospora tetrasperma FGSC 2508]EGZ71566.1 hypothetical protein NEUTE2DRAFT_144541 [Neurospora tetrasperma FGSC 2509]